MLGAWHVRQVDNHALPIALKDMETELQILSVRKMVKRNNEVKFKKDRGFIRNRDTGRLLKFHEHEGVYFLKLKVLDPSSLNLLSDGNEQVFGRQRS